MASKFFKIGYGAIKQLNKNLAKGVVRKKSPEDVYKRIHRDWLKKEISKAKNFKTPPVHIGEGKIKKWADVDMFKRGKKKGKK